MTETKRAQVLMPVVATLASAAASYLAKKGPEYLERTVVPKVRETNDSAELAQRRRERAEHRAARRRAS
jgi:hypothetical protein